MITMYLKAADHWRQFERHPNVQQESHRIARRSEQGQLRRQVQGRARDKSAGVPARQDARQSGASAQVVDPETEEARSSSVTPAIECRGRRQ